MASKSAGILAFRIKLGTPEYFLAHPGGPFYKNKDKGVWTIPKGEFNDDEDPMEAAIREFEEETGQKISGNFISLDPIKYKSGKIVYAWGVEFDFNEKNISSNKFKIEWPPNSGKQVEFPEIDRAEWFLLEEAKEKILPAQFPLLEELNSKIKK